MTRDYLTEFQSMVGCAKHKWRAVDLDYAECACGAQFSAGESEPSATALNVRTLWGAMVAADKVAPKLQVDPSQGVNGKIEVRIWDGGAWDEGGLYATELEACTAIAKAVIEWKEAYD